MIGDRVTVSESVEVCTVESVEDRTTELVRRGRGGRAPKVLAANLDRVFAVLALGAPPASLEIIDRLLVLVEASGMRPILLLNKLDLEGAPEAARAFSDLYEDIGYRTLPVSATSKEGLELFRAELRRGSSALIGPSGVGKSSLLNALEPGLQLRTRGLSRKTGTGRHTTVGSRLITLARGGLVADTPGFGDVALWGIAPDGVESCFPELGDHVERCRFRSCTHVHEPDCGVRSAVEDGQILQSRYGSYLRLRNEAVEAAAR